MWYLLAFLSVLAMSGTNIVDKVISKTPDKSFSLIVRYAVSLLLLGGISSLFIQEIPSVYIILALMWVWILNYLVNVLMYKWLWQIHTWVFFIIGYLYLIFLFFVNIFLFWSDEILSIEKILFWIWFIISVFSIIYLTGENHRVSWYSGYIFALLCAIGWTISFGISAYMIKVLHIHPVTVLFFEILGAFIFGIGAFFLQRKNHTGRSYGKSDFLAPALAGLFLSTWLVLFLLAYRYLPANIVNIISLFDLVVTCFFGYFFLKEKLSKGVLWLGLLGFLLLIAFSVV